MRKNVEIRHGDYRKVLAEETADIIITSPPYNIGSDSPARTGKRCSKRKTYDPKSYRGVREYFDKLPQDKYERWQTEFLEWCGRHLKRHGTVFYNHKPRRKDGELIHPMRWISQVNSLILTDEIVWDRGSTHNNGPHIWRPTTERIYVFRRRGDPLKRINREKLKWTGDLWRCPPPRPNGHNAPFPEQIAENCIKAYATESCVVMDPFSGSGTTAAVAFRLGHEFVGAEKLKKYVNLSRRRISERGN